MAGCFSGQERSRYSCLDSRPSMNHLIGQVIVAQRTISAEMTQLKAVKSSLDQKELMAGCFSGQERSRYSCLDSRPSMNHPDRASNRCPTAYFSGDDPSKFCKIFVGPKGIDGGVFQWPTTL